MHTKWIKFHNYIEQNILFYSPYLACLMLFFFKLASKPRVSYCCTIYTHSLWKSPQRLATHCALSIQFPLNNTVVWDLGGILMKYKFEYLSLLSIQFIIKCDTWNRKDSLYAVVPHQSCIPTCYLLNRTLCGARPSTCNLAASASNVELTGIRHY